MEVVGWGEEIESIFYIAVKISNWMLHSQTNGLIVFLFVLSRCYRIICEWGGLVWVLFSSFVFYFCYVSVSYRILACLVRECSTSC